MSNGFIKPANIIIKKGVMEAFRKRAWKVAPNEWYEALWGYVTKSDVHILTTMPIKQIATPDSVIVDDNELRDLYEEAESYGVQVVGSIHTHPCPEDVKPKEYLYPSLTDHHMGVDWNELVMGITALWLPDNGKKKGVRGRSKTMWWFPQPRLKVRFD